MNDVLIDPFGTQIRCGDAVFFAGTDHNRKPTINKGHVEDVNIPARKVLIRRTVRSGNGISDSTTVRMTWVEITKVGVITND